MSLTLQSAQAPFCFPEDRAWEESRCLAALSVNAGGFLVLSHRCCDTGTLTWSSKRIDWASCDAQEGDQHKLRPQGWESGPYWWKGQHVCSIPMDETIIKYLLWGVSEFCTLRFLVDY